MAITVPIQITRIRALMQHHIDSEPEGSEYTLKMDCQGSHTTMTYEISYMSGRHRVKTRTTLRVWPKSRLSDEEPLQFMMSLDSNHFGRVEQSAEVIKYGGVFIKAGNLMKQVKEMLC